MQPADPVRNSDDGWTEDGSLVLRIRNDLMIGAVNSAVDGLQMGLSSSMIQHMLLHTARMFARFTVTPNDRPAAWLKDQMAVALFPHVPATN